MKQMEVTRKEIGENVFYMKKFPAFVAANISGDLSALATPILGKLIPAFGVTLNSTSDEVQFDLMDVDIEKAGPALADAFSDVSGDQFERLMKKLLTDNKNISVEGEATDGEAKILTYELANEVFCGELLDMYKLCFEVIKLNFASFFKKIAGRFGSRREADTPTTPNTKSGESLT